MLTHDEYPCHCLLQTWWYPERSNLVLIWDSEELLSMDFTRLITAHNKSDSGSYDGDTMAGSSCEREQETGSANERTVAEIGLSKRFRSF